MFHRLASLDGTKTDWRVKVRVTRIWISMNNGDNTIQGYNLILLDAYNDHMHAFVQPQYWNHLQNDIVEGNIYEISKFWCKEANGFFRPVSTGFCIRFSISTTVQHIVQEDAMIPLHKFEFRALSDLYQVASDYPEGQTPSFTTDVIGVVENLEQLRVIQTLYGERQLVRFTLTDGRYSHKVNIWGSLTASTQPLYQGGLETPIIVILASTRLQKFQGKVSITSLPSTKIFINLQQEDVITMRQRLNAEGYEGHVHHE